MAQEKLKIILEGDSKSAQAAVQSLSGSFGNFGKQLLGLAGIGGGFALVTKGLQSIEQGFQKTIQFIKESTEEAGKAEAALVKLNTALKSSGEFTQENSQALQDYAESLQRVTAFEDDDIIASEARLAMFGLTTEEIKIATQATLDLAAATGMDLNAATVLMGKAMVGETGTLKRYGIVIDENKLATEGWKAVIDEVTAKFGGQAAAAGETYLGTIERIKNNIGNLKEEIGGAFLPVLKNLTNTFTDNLPAIQKKVEDLARKISEFFDALMGADWSSVITSIKNLGGTLNILITGDSSFTTAEEKAQNFADTLSKTVDVVARLAVGAKLLGEAILLSWRSFDLFGQNFGEGFVENLKADWEAWLKVFNRGISETDLLINGYDQAKTSIDGFMASLAGASGAADKASESTDGAAKSIGDISEAADTATQTLKGLYDELFSIYNLNQSVTEATWSFDEAVKAAEKTVKDKNATDKEQQESLFKVQDALESLQGKLLEGIQTGDLSIGKQYELSKAFVDSGIKAVDLGIISKTEFEKMAQNLGINVEKMGGSFGKLGTDADKASGKVKSLRDFIDGLKSKEIDIVVNHRDYYGEATYKPGQLNKQSGGTARQSQYVTDLSLPMIGGEALIPRELTRAIKENRSSFAGVKADSQSSNVTINVAVTGNNISSDLDIDILAEKLADKVRSTQRGAGIRW